MGGWRFRNGCPDRACDVRFGGIGPAQDSANAAVMMDLVDTWRVRLRHERHIVCVNEYTRELADKVAGVSEGARRHCFG